MSTATRGSPPDSRCEGIPTLLLFKGGQVVDQVVGAVPKEKLAEMLESHVSG